MVLLTNGFRFLGSFFFAWIRFLEHGSIDWKGYIMYIMDQKMKRRSPKWILLFYGSIIFTGLICSVCSLKGKWFAVRVTHLTLRDKVNKENLCCYSIMMITVETPLTISPKSGSDVLHLVIGGFFFEQESADWNLNMKSDNLEYQYLTQGHPWPPWSGGASARRRVP